MNERINQLLCQAYDEAVPETWTELSSEQLGRIYDKFAELIVRECLNVLKLAHSEGNEDAYSYDDALDHAEYNIKQHFGVEE